MENFQTVLNMLGNLFWEWDFWIGESYFLTLLVLGRILLIGVLMGIVGILLSRGNNLYILNKVMLLTERQFPKIL